jgi:hypothetical protein
MRRCLIALLVLSAWAGEPPPLTAEAATGIETHLDVFCAESDPAKRTVLFNQGLIGQGLDENTLQAMADRRDPPAGAVRPGWRIPWPVQTAGGSATAAAATAGAPCTGFHLLLPPGYDPSEARPVILILHPGTMTGEALAGRLGGSCARQGAIVAVPELPGGRWDEPGPRRRASELVAWIVRSYRVDCRKIAIAGIGTGGDGAWALVRDHPGAWSAIAMSGAIPVRLPKDSPDRFAGLHLRATAVVGTGGMGALQTAGTIRKAVEDWQALGLDASYAEDPPGDGIFDAMAAWLRTVPARPDSPRPQWIQRGAAPLPLEDPLGFRDDPVMALIRAGKTVQAAGICGDRLQRRANRRDHLLRAIARLPALLDPFPDPARPIDFLEPRGRWTTAAEDSALVDLNQAITAEPEPPAQFVAVVYRHAAVIHAKRTICLLPEGGKLWTVPYQAFTVAMKAAWQSAPDDPELRRITDTLRSQLPMNIPSP